MPKYFIFSRRKRMCLCIIYSKSKSELFGFERGGRWRWRQIKTLVDTEKQWRQVAGGSLTEFRLSFTIWII